MDAINVSNSIKFLGMMRSRLYADFFMPSRLPELGELLKLALRKGYLVCSKRDFWHASERGQRRPAGKYFILRHDVDTDPATARCMWTLERDLGVNGSFYFRLSTIDVPFMREIEAAGGEASYHYEELATISKRENLRNREHVLARMPAITQMFEKNLRELRSLTGLPMTSVASHGDFVNRKLSLTNAVTLGDERLRHRLGIEFEAYDIEFMKYIRARFSDAAACVEAANAKPWIPYHPSDAINSGTETIYILLHPRQWKANFNVNVVDNMKRIFEGLRYSM